MRHQVSARDALWPVVFLSALSVALWKMPGLFAAIGLNDAPDPGSAWPAGIAVAVLLIATIIGTAAVRPVFDEIAPSSWFDRFSMFLSRPSMLLIGVMVLVMIYEVVSRYLFQSPTMWANELTIWIAASLFLIAGPYVHHQRAHVAVTLLHQHAPRWLRHVFDVISGALLIAFAVALVWGGLNEAATKFATWERMGTIFDPPIPATLKPLVLATVVLTAVQEVSNLICGWNRRFDYEVVDPAEIEVLKADLATRIRARKKD